MFFFPTIQQVAMETMANSVRMISHTSIRSWRWLGGCYSRMASLEIVFKCYPLLSIAITFEKQLGITRLFILLKNNLAPPGFSYFHQCSLTAGPTPWFQPENTSSSIIQWFKHSNPTHIGQLWSHPVGADLAPQIIPVWGCWVCAIVRRPVNSP